jgi:hydrophobe/amphiphile efflux-1 (HAE1) family protein
MSDVTSAVIATTLVLLGIFVPVSFMSGITGRIYQQFAVTLSAAVCFSTVCALTLAPALCSLLLREVRPPKHGPLAWFNFALASFKNSFVVMAKWLARRMILVSSLLIMSIILTMYFFKNTQTSFLPDEDQSVVFCAMEMPEGSARDRTRDVALRAVKMLREIPEINSIMSITGFSMVGGRGENQTMLICDLKDWDERPLPEQHAQKILEKMTVLLQKVPEPKWRVFMPPAIPGLGNSGGVKFHLLDRVSSDPVKLDEVQKGIIAKIMTNPKVFMAFSDFNAETPHLKFNLDRDKAEMFRVPVATVYATLQNYLGSKYVNDVNLGTQVNKVTICAEPSARMTAESVERLYVRSSSGAMVPMGSLGTVSRENGPRAISTRDKYMTTGITVMPKPGVATGEIMAELEELLNKELPEGYGFDWADLSFQEARNEGSAAPLILLAVLFGYLFLVAQYESWTIPMPVMLSIFVAILGALIGIRYFGYSLSIYAQLGLVLLVGLASKNAILLVEFAKDKREIEKYSIVDAAGAAAGERLRALLMTAFTTLLGTLPMMIATGAGAASRNHLGTTEFFGMLFSVVFGIVLVPGLYALFQTWRERAKRMFEYFSIRSTRARRDKYAKKNKTESEKE